MQSGPETNPGDILTVLDTPINHGDSWGHNQHILGPCGGLTGTKESQVTNGIPIEHAFSLQASVRKGHTLTRINPV